MHLACRLEPCGVCAGRPDRLTGARSFPPRQALSCVNQPDAPPVRPAFQSIWAGPPLAVSSGSDCGREDPGSILGRILFQAPTLPRRSRAQPHSLILPTPFPGGCIRLHLQTLQRKLKASGWPFASHLNISQSRLPRRAPVVSHLGVLPAYAPSLAGVHHPCLLGLHRRLPGRRM